MTSVYNERTRQKKNHQLQTRMYWLIKIMKSLISARLRPRWLFCISVGTKTTVPVLPFCALFFVLHAHSVCTQCSQYVCNMQKHYSLLSCQKTRGVHSPLAKGGPAVSGPGWRCCRSHEVQVQRGSDSFLHWSVFVLLWGEFKRFLWVHRRGVNIPWRSQK